MNAASSKYRIGKHHPPLAIPRKIPVDRIQSHANPLFEKDAKRLLWRWGRDNALRKMQGLYLFLIGGVFLNGEAMVKITSCLVPPQKQEPDPTH